MGSYRLAIPGAIHTKYIVVENEDTGEKFTIHTTYGEYSRMSSEERRKFLDKINTDEIHKLK